MEPKRAEHRVVRGAVAAALAAALAIGAPDARAARGQNLELSVGLSSEYDSNLLQYSDNQRDLFVSGTRAERFSIQSLDDAVWNPTAGLQWLLDQGHGRRHTLRARFTGEFHSKNSTADFHSFSASWREGFHGNRRLSLGIYSLPNYYLRQLVAEDYVPPFPGMTRYRRAEFGLTIGSAAWSQPLNDRTDAELGYQLEDRRYNADFTERDSKTHQAKVTLDFATDPRRSDVSLIGGYRWDLAKGEDGDEPEPVPDEDVSYHGPIAGIEGRWELARNDAARWTGDLGYHFGYRGYDSDRPTDLYHFGRHDVIQTLEAGLRWSPRPHWSARGFYLYENSTATLGTNSPPSSDVGSYQQYKAGLGVEWSGGVWHERRRSKATPSE